MALKEWPFDNNVHHQVHQWHQVKQKQGFWVKQKGFFFTLERIFLVFLVNLVPLVVKIQGLPYDFDSSVTKEEPYLVPLVVKKLRF